ncbi:MAG: FUSC family protein [Dermatophilaceae bacterium]
MVENIFRDTRVEALFERARRRSRRSVRHRLDRLQDKSFHVIQCSLAAGVAWLIAHDLLGHPMPFFAPIVAVICLGMTYAQRLRRVAEVTVGVAVGVAIADVFVSIAGSGAWQVAAVVLVAMSVALLLDAGLLLVMQSAVQSIVVTVLVPAPGQAFLRWFDAVIGGVVALVFAALVPGAPLRRPRRQAAKVASRMAVLLRDAASSARSGDVEHAAEVLAQARETDELIRELQDAADEGMSVIAATPWRRADSQSVRTIASVVDPLDRVVRSTRVLVRRVSIATYHQAQIPPVLASAWEELAAAVDVLARAWHEDRTGEFARPAMLAVGERIAALEPGEYHTDRLAGADPDARRRPARTHRPRSRRRRRDLPATRLASDRFVHPPQIVPPSPDAHPPRFDTRGRGRLGRPVSNRKGRGTSGIKLGEPQRPRRA